MMKCIEQDSLSTRRSVYDLDDMLPVSENCFIETVENCLRHCPTPFNVQSARLVILLHRYHLQFWDMTETALLKIAGEKSRSIHEKIAGFAAAHGTILFFEDSGALRSLKKQFPLYAGNMPIWVQQANGMLQYMIWQALAENDIGASLQHYNELIEADTSKWLELPKTWKMVAQMPFGNIKKNPAAKTFLPIEDRLMIFK